MCDTYVQNDAYAHSEPFLLSICLYCTASSRISSPTTVHSSLANSLKRYAPSEVLNTLSLQRAVCKSAPKPKNTTKRSSLAFKVTLQNTKKIVTIFVQPLKYAQSTQVRRNSNRTPVRPRLCQHPPGTTLLCANSIVPTDACGKTSPQILCSKLEARIWKLRAKVDAHSKKSQQRYNHDCNHRVHEIPKFKPHELVFFPRLPLTETKDNEI